MLLAAAGILTAPVSMSYMRAPRLHQSTARLWPLRVRISGALEEEEQEEREEREEQEVQEEGTEREPWARDVKCASEIHGRDLS